jgi:hypothetical protein
MVAWAAATLKAALIERRRPHQRERSGRGRRDPFVSSLWMWRQAAADGADDAGVSREETGRWYPDLAARTTTTSTRPTTWTADDVVAGRVIAWNFG